MKRMLKITGYLQVSKTWMNDLKLPSDHYFEEFILEGESGDLNLYWYNLNGRVQVEIRCLDTGFDLIPEAIELLHMKTYPPHPEEFKQILDSYGVKPISMNNTHPYSFEAVAPGQIPHTVCLCGSTRFYKEFMRQNRIETMKGHIVLSVGFFAHASNEIHGEKIEISKAEKQFLDELHKRKIDVSQEILVINVDGYIGESTRSEIEYAHRTGKGVRYLEPIE